MQPITFGRWIKKLRTEQDLTQEMLSELVGCATPTLRAFELGARRPSREMADRIADVLNVPVDQRTEFVRLARLPVEHASEAPAKSLATSPPAPAASAPNLPQAVHPLIGREAERNALRALLLKERIRLVTIAGAGGMGKTRLALDVAATVSPEFAQGAVFVALAAVQQARNLPVTLADALGISLQGVHDIEQHLLAQLADRHLLLVLDNFEHLLAEPPALALVKTILLGAPQVQLLITSRERLRVSGERTFELGGLPLSSKTQPADSADALMLFLARAQQVDSAFVLDNSNRSAITRICQLLGGMPLGIELATAWVRTLSCAEIAEEIARNLDFLELADRDAAPRHRNMRAVFDHSWQLLNEAEQRVLMGLSYFRGGCSRQAAEQVAGANLPLLASLIDKSLLTRSEGGRFVLHELIRQFASERLQQDSTLATRVAAAHAHDYGDFLHRNRGKLQSTQQPQAIAEISAEMENLRLAWSWICQQQIIAQTEPFATLFHYYCEVRGLHLEGDTLARQWFALNSLPAELATDQTEAGEFSDQQVACWALLYGALAAAASRTTKPDQAIAAHHQSLALARRSKSSVAGFYTTLWAGFSYTIKGEHAEGHALMEEALQHASDMGDSWSMALAEIGLGFAHLHRQEPVLAHPHLQRAYERLSLLGDPHLLAVCAGQLSLASNLLGLPYDVRHLLEESLRNSRRRGDQGTSAMVLLRLGQESKVQGNWSEAEQLIGEAIELMRLSNEYWVVSEAQLDLAEILVALGRSSEAEARYRLTIDTARTGKISNILLNAQLGLAALLLGKGKLDEAGQLLNEAQQLPHPTPQQAAHLQELRNQLTVRA